MKLKNLTSWFEIVGTPLKALRLFETTLPFDNMMGVRDEGMIICRWMDEEEGKGHTNVWALDYLVELAYM